MDEVVMNKVATVERCLRRVTEEYDPNSFTTDYKQQDSIILNIQRAIQASIDLGAHLIRVNRWGIPQEYRAVFDVLSEHRVIGADLSERLKKMVSFRNIAVHDYQKLNLEIVESIVKNHLSDLTNYTKAVLS